MKAKLLLLLALLWIMSAAMAQAPPLMNYQAVVRNAQGQAVQNTLVNFQFQIHQDSLSGTVAFTETDTVTTNQFGLATVQIGNSSHLGNVSWGTGNQYLQVGLDITGNQNFVDMGTSQLLSVPYALYSGNGGSGGGWGLTGNTGTTYGANFIGTADTVNLMFRIHDSIAGRIEYNPTNNTSFGLQALDVNTGTSNSAFGLHALYFNTSGNNNTAVGAGAIRNNTIGAGNTAIGANSLYYDTAGSSNTALGNEALKNNTSGSYNIAIGANSGLINTTGSNNVVIGYNAGTGLGSVHNATAIGANAIAANNNAFVLGDPGNDTIAVGIGTSVPAAKLDINAAAGFNALHIAGLTGGSNSDNVLAINATTGMVDSIHLLHHIGESFGGGIVFWVYDNGAHGLIAAASDQSAGMRWYAGASLNTMAYAGTGGAAGAGGGKANTALIIASQGYGDANTYAARVCNEYTATVAGDTYQDWYLPSLAELILMYANIGQGATGTNHNLGGFAGSNYWSSTEFSSTTAYVENFSVGAYVAVNKPGTNYVRAVRSF